MARELRSALVVFLTLTLLTGVAYPLLATLIGQVAFHGAVNGSVLRADGRDVASRLIGQPFADPKYFWSRPSATGPAPYNGGLSSGSNQGPTNPAFATAVRDRITALHAADPSNAQLVPIDLVTASGSGLDPHISPAAAQYQVARVARARGLEESAVRSLVDAATEGRTFGLLGEPRVNVVELNLALERTSR